MELFEAVADAVVGMVPAELGAPRCKAHRYGVKVWFGGEKPEREHYEAQVINARHVRAAKVLAIEVGFHAEHPKPADNDAVLATVMAEEKSWRKVLGVEAEAGEFLGREGWTRLSETWPDPSLDDEEIAFELAARLTDYITVVEPILRKRG